MAPVTFMAKKKAKIVDPNLENFPATGEDTNEFWIGLVRRTLEAQRRDIDEAKKAIRMYKGDHWSQMGDDSLRGDYADNPNDLITVNVTRSNVKSLLPFLLNKTPKWMPQPTSAEWVENAKILGGVMDYHWREFKMQKSARKSVLWGIVTGKGIMKTGYTYDLEEIEGKNPDKDGVIEYSVKIREEFAWIKPVDRLKFIWDLDAEDGTLDTARWCAEIFFKNPADVMANQAYWKAAPGTMQKIKDGMYTPETIASNLDLAWNDDNELKDAYRNSGDFQPQRKWVLFEIWDKKFKKRMVYIDGVPEPVMDQPHECFKYLDGFPYAVYDFSEDIDDPFGVGLPYDMRQQQFELDRMRTLGIQHVRRFNRRYEVVKSMLTDDEQLEGLMHGPDGTIITVKAKGAVNPIQDAPLANDKYRQEELIKDDIREMTGVDSTIKNAPLPARTSATEVQSRVGIANAKIDFLTEQIDAFFNEIGTQLMQHIQYNMETPMMVEIMGEKGKEYVEATKDKIKGEFYCYVESTAKPKIDPETKKQAFTSLVQAIVVPLAQTGMISSPNFNKILEKLFEMNDLEYEYQEITAPQPVTNPQTGQVEDTLPPQISPQQQTAQVNAVNPASMQQGPKGGL